MRLQVGRERAERDAHQATATAADGPDDTDRQTTAGFDGGFMDAAATTSGDPTTDMNPAYNDRGTGAHRGR